MPLYSYIHHQQLKQKYGVIAVGAVLVQLQHEVWRPLSVWSKLLNKAQCGYSATDMELLAVSYAVAESLSYLEGQPLVVRTDHNALVGSLTKKADTALPIPRRHLLKIAQFVNKLHYLQGERNVLRMLYHASYFNRRTVP